jgi:hypothetical protein
VLECNCLALKPKVGGSLFQITKSLIARYRFLISGAKSNPLKGEKSDGAISENLPFSGSLQANR